MPAKYKAYKKRNGINKKSLYYAHVLRTETVNLKRISERMSFGTTLTPGAVYNTMIQFVYTLKLFLDMGCHVNIEGLGTFSISATSEGCETEEECTPGKVKANRVCFLPSRDLKNFLETIKFDKM